MPCGGGSLSVLSSLILLSAGERHDVAPDRLFSLTGPAGSAGEEEGKKEEEGSCGAALEPTELPPQPKSKPRPPPPPPPPPPPKTEAPLPGGGKTGLPGYNPYGV